MSTLLMCVTERDEIESFRDALREKTRENRSVGRWIFFFSYIFRELALRIQELERSMSEYQGMRARLQNTRDELNDYKIKVWCIGH